MTNGPPPSAASSSRSPDSDLSLTNSQNVPTQAVPVIPPASSASAAAMPPNYSNYSWQNYWNQYSQYASMQSQNSTGQQMTSTSNQNGASNPYAAMYQSNGYSQPLQNFYNQPSQATAQKGVPTPQVSNPSPISAAPTKSPTPPPKPATPPAPETYKHWDDVIKKFLDRTGMVQASKGLEQDMLVLNPTFEQNNVPSALEELSRGLQDILARISGKKVVNDDDMQVDDSTEQHGQSLDERKLGYVKLANGSTPRTQSSINKSISQFLARTRARNDASNKSEFLLSLAEKKRKLQEDGQAPVQFASSSCARVDARTIDREKQMKYDIAKNEEGPLSRSHQKQAQPSGDSSSNVVRKQSAVQDEDDAMSANVTAARHPSLDERLNNIETHVAVRYVPSPPKTLLARLKYVEEHINRLERDYPPWAALHFNQPRRGWPPPPRATPIIVPAHLRSTNSDKTATSTTITSAPTPSSAASNPTPALSNPTEGSMQYAPPVKKAKSKSSLHKAVLERLEVQRAMNEMNTK